MDRTGVQGARHRGVGELGVEVRCVRFRGERRLERRYDILALQLGPVDVGKELVLAEFLRVVGCAQAMLGVPVEQLW